MPPKKKKSKAKNQDSVLGGNGDYAEKTYKQVCKEDMEYVDKLINSKDPLGEKEEEFVDFLLNVEAGRKLYSTWKKKSQGGCQCTIQ